MKRVHERVRRLLALIPYLRSRQGATIKELADYAGVSKRQILKDLDCVLMCGVPPYLPDDYVTCWIEEGRVYIEFADHFRRPARLRLEEALCLKIFLKELPLSVRNSKSEFVESIETKLTRATSAAVALDEIVEDEYPPSMDTELRDAVEGAVRERHLLRMEYFSYGRGELTERVVKPLVLTSRRGMLYLLACDGVAGEDVRSFRVDRIKSVEALAGRFDPPAGVDLENEVFLSVADHMEERFNVRVRFSSEVARWIREAYAEIVEKDDGDDGLTVSFRTNNPRWAALWVLPYGENAEILEPAEARAEMRKIVRAMLGPDIS